jgi:flagellar basal body rod protein FlgB
MKLTSSAVLLVLLALAGCGGSDGSFTNDYNEAVKPLRDFGQGMGTQAREFDRLAQRTSQIRRNLAELDPPDHAQDEFDALLARLDRVTADVRAVAAATRSKDVVRQRRAAKRLVRSSTAVQRAETALKAAVEG